MSYHVINFSNVSYVYPNGFIALSSVSFSISHGEKVAIFGANGAGKSTLLLHTNGLLLPTAGEVNIGGIPVNKHTLRSVRQKVGMVFQNPDDQLFMPTVEADVAFGPANMHLPQQEINRRIDYALNAVGCAELRHRASYQLSGGQRRAVAIATVLSMLPDILVLDEPSANLDIYARRHLINIVAHFPHTCLIATHDIPLAQQLCRRAIVLHKGNVIADIPINQLTNIFPNYTT